MHDQIKDPGVCLACFDLFNYLPFAALLQSVFAMHGGLSPSVHLLDQTTAVDCFQEPVPETPMSDLVWNTRSRRSRQGSGYSLGDDVASSMG
jgi:diadenosine tetraphosphatase ApaH/serine/threonine PP2A family protein phosphatase